MDSQLPSDVTRPAAGLILGAVLDFTVFLNQSKAPIIVGNEYPADKLIDAINEWCKMRNVDINLGNRDAWQAAARTGAFAKDESDETTK